LRKKRAKQSGAFALKIDAENQAKIAAHIVAPKKKLSPLFPMVSRGSR